MIAAKELLNVLKKNKINFFTGVPDSVLKSLSKKFNNYLHRSKSKRARGVSKSSFLGAHFSYLINDL